ncbi:hypothetical protein LC612_42415, partial [Nostoc sp. CHAB 5834]|nr:hypothetical protein [Nostoc sp. CHAB 5834]
MTAISSDWVLHDETIHAPDELIVYFQNRFCASETRQFPVPMAEPSIASWAEYVTKFRDDEVFPLLQTCYPQLNFPVREGINKTQAYTDAVLKGKP